MRPVDLETTTQATTMEDDALLHTKRKEGATTHRSDREEEAPRLGTARPTAREMVVKEEEEDPPALLGLLDPPATRADFLRIREEDVLLRDPINALWCREEVAAGPRETREVQAGHKRKFLDPRTVTCCRPSTPC